MPAGAASNTRAIRSCPSAIAEPMQRRHGFCSSCLKMRQWLRTLAILALGIGCSSSGGATSPMNSAGAGGEPAAVSVELGTPGGDDGLEFVPMTDGTELRLQTFGQGGTHVLVGVRCTGFGSRAFVSAELENLTSGVAVEEPAPARPQLLYCSDRGDCDLVPYLVHASGLTKTDSEKDGLHVRLTVHVRNEAGASGDCSREAVLSTADL